MQKIFLFDLFHRRPARRSAICLYIINSICISAAVGSCRKFHAPRKPYLLLLIIYFLLLLITYYFTLQTEIDNSRQ